MACQLDKRLCRGVCQPRDVQTTPHPAPQGKSVDCLPAEKICLLRHTMDEKICLGD